jgi:hypothetical protein
LSKWERQSVLSQKQSLKNNTDANDTQDDEDNNSQDSDNNNDDNYIVTNRTSEQYISHAISVEVLKALEKHKDGKTLFRKESKWFESLMKFLPEEEASRFAGLDTSLRTLKIVAITIWSKRSHLLTEYKKALDLGVTMYLF